MIANFKGIILQPISKLKEPWKGYDNTSDFLTFFQNTFKKNIGSDFYVNQDTKQFSDYLLIPYYTENKKCFGAYYIKYGTEIENDNYSHSYHLDYLKSFDFIKEVFNYEIIEEAEFNNGRINKISNDNRIYYYELTNLSDNFINYINTLK